MRQCGLEDKLSELGLNRPQIAAAVGNSWTPAASCGACSSSLPIPKFWPASRPRSKTCSPACTPPPGTTVVMDAGIAAQVNLTWLREQGYHYVVVSKLRQRQFDPALATEVQSAGDVTIKLQAGLTAPSGKAGKTGL